MSGTRDENLFMARLSEQAERFDDMVEYMKRVAAMGAGLNGDERRLVSVAFKESLSELRSAWRRIRAEEESKPEVAHMISDYRKTVEAKLDEKCKDIIGTLETNLIPQAAEGDAKIFFLKMKGDYYRYHAEIKTEATGLSDTANKANFAYAEALKEAETHLGAADPTRLGIALNYSVFFQEVTGNTVEALQLARTTCEQAEAAISALDEASQQDALQVLLLLKENVQLWQSSAQARAGGRAPELDGTAVEDL